MYNNRDFKIAIRLLIVLEAKDLISIFSFLQQQDLKDNTFYKIDL